MGIDIKKLKEKLSNLKENGSGEPSKSKYIFKPTEEKKDIRILPYAWCKDNPFQELWMYWNIKKGTALVSPKTIGEEAKDPIIKYSYEIKKRYASDPEGWKKAADYQPKLRIFVPVIVRGEEAEGVKFWGFGKDVYKKLLDLFTDSDYVNEENESTIIDLNEGRDITVWSESVPGKTFTTPNFKPRLKISKAVPNDDAKLLKKLLTEQPKLLGDIYEVATVEELSNALNDYINALDGVSYEPSNKEDKKSENKKPVVDVDEDEESIDDIMKEFEEIK